MKLHKTVYRPLHAAAFISLPIKQGKTSAWHPVADPDFHRRRLRQDKRTARTCNEPHSPAETTDRDPDAGRGKGDWYWKLFDHFHTKESQKVAHL